MRIQLTNGFNCIGIISWHFIRNLYCGGCHTYWLNIISWISLVKCWISLVGYHQNNITYWICWILIVRIILLIMIFQCYQIYIYIYITSRTINLFKIGTESEIIRQSGGYVRISIAFAINLGQGRWENGSIRCLQHFIVCCHRFFYNSHGRFSLCTEVFLQIFLYLLNMACHQMSSYVNYHGI